jgi:type II secretory pathway pseudopilin PulG
LDYLRRALQQADFGRHPAVKTVRGFTLAELAIAALIFALLTATLVYTFGARVEQRNIDEGRRRLELAREQVLGFVAANGRLPCPARCSSWPKCDAGTYTTGEEVWDSVTGKCEAAGLQDYYGGTIGVIPGPPPSTVMGGLLPAAALGFPHTDARGYAVDPWGNRIRYAVAKTVAAGSCGVTPPGGTIVFTHAGNLRTYGMACAPADLLVCKSSAVTPAMSATSCGSGTPPANQVTDAARVVAIIFTTGSNGARDPDASRKDEAANLDGGGNVNPIFVHHRPQPSGAAGGEFDDDLTWITIGELMERLVAADHLP